MRAFFVAVLFTFAPALAHAQAQGGPEPPPTDAAPAPPASDPNPLNPSPELPSSAPAPTAAPDPVPSPASTSAPVPAPASSPKPARAPTPTVVARKSEPSYEEAEARWKFSYHGYLRAPMRIGFGKRLPEDTNDYTISGQTDTTIHEATVPDDQALSFQSTQHNPRAWAEGFFGFGNGVATGVLGIGSYNLTEGGFNDFRANWGITQAYVLLTPDLGFENVRIWAKAGAIVDRYGMSGRYDSGEYDMYVFGRTHVVGETFHLDYDLDNTWTLYLEQGLGTHKPDPSAYNNARFTLLHHEHAGLKLGRDFELGAHYLVSWSQEEYRFQDTADDPNNDVNRSGVDDAPRNGLPNGKLWVAGVEARAELGAFGYLYGAYSHVGADYALTVSRAVEVLHASGGGEFDLGVVSNYLDSPRCHDVPQAPPTPPTGAPENWLSLDPDACSDGNGFLNALHGQYEFSLTNFRQQITGGPRFWGQGFDAILKLYGLVAFVKSEARDTTQGPKTGGIDALEAADLPNHYTVTKAKFGADLTIQALPWLSPALRFDRVMPNSHIPEQSFSILSPRLQFKTAWVTHERITLGYSRYFYARRVCEPRVPNDADPGGTGPDTSEDALAGYRCTQAPPSPVPYDGFGSTTAKQDPPTRASGVARPDENVFKVEATMWW